MEKETACKKLLLTSLSAALAETATFPIDLTKTRLQLSLSSHSLSASSVAIQILRREGIAGLYRGLSPAIFRHLLYTPLRIVGYEQLRNLSGSDDDGVSFVGKAFIGGLSGVFAQVIASPADLVKVRLQADGQTVSQGLQPRHSGPFGVLNKIIQNEGIGGLWKGVIPNTQRAFLVNMGELACYDHAKHFIIRNKIAKDNIFAHTLAAVMSGLAATSLSCPADVVKTRMMNQQSIVEGKVRYINSYDCLVKTIKIEGVRALWKGFLPTWARLGPWQFVFWVSYEKLRKVAGFSSF